MFAIIKDIISIIKDGMDIFSKRVKEKKKEQAQFQYPIPFRKARVQIFSVQNDIEGLQACIKGSATEHSNAVVYFSSYDVSIRLTFCKEGLLVQSSYTINFVNPLGENYRFKRKPMVRDGLQYDTYRFTDVRYQNRLRSDLIQTYDPMEQPPHPNYRFKTGVELSLPKDLLESVLHFSAEYKTESTQFFNTFQFYNYCKHLSVDVILEGESAEDYELQWDVFLNSNSNNHRATRNVPCNEPNHIHFSVGDWIFPGNAYVITVNKKR